MSLLKRITKNLTRNKRYIILLLLFFIIVYILFTGYFIKKSLATLYQGVESTMGGEVKMIEDIEQEEIEGYTISELDKFNLFDSIIGYDYNTHLSVTSNELEPIMQGESESGKINITPFQLKGINYEKTYDFEKGRVQLIEGTFFTQKNLDTGAEVVLISDILAENNNIAIGELIEVHSLSEISSVGEKDKQTAPQDVIQGTSQYLEVIGIYKYTQPINIDSQSGNDFIKNIELLMQDQRMNTMYVPNQINDLLMSEHLLAELNQEEGQNFGEVTFFLTHENQVEEFISQATSLLPKGYRFVSVQDVLGKVIYDLALIETIGNYMFFGTSIIVVVLLFMLQYYIFKQRKIEFGIYLSLGVRKIEIGIQVILEMLILFSISTIFAFGASTLSNNSIMEFLIQNETIVQQNYTETNITLELADMQIQQTELALLSKTNITIFDFFIVTIVMGIIAIIGGGSIFVYLSTLKAKELLFE